MLSSILKNEDYGLALAPGFFCFYAEMGVLHAFEEQSCLRSTHVSGSSAGALVGGFLAAGMKPKEMRAPVFEMKREDIWDMGGIGGLLKGQLIQQILERLLPVKTFEECPLPLGVTAWDLLRFRTKNIQKGDIATAIRASACFPVLFAPVMIDGTPHIDGGVYDHCGLFALPGVPDSNLIVNILCGRSSLSSSKPPEKFPSARLITIVIENVPQVNPFTMATAGPEAYRVAYAATIRALSSSHIQMTASNHMVVYVDGSTVGKIDMPLPLAFSSGIKDSEIEMPVGPQSLKSESGPEQVENVPQGASRKRTATKVEIESGQKSRRRSKHKR